MQNVWGKVFALYGETEATLKQIVEVWNGGADCLIDVDGVKICASILDFDKNAYEADSKLRLKFVLRNDYDYAGFPAVFNNTAELEKIGYKASEFVSPVYSQDINGDIVAIPTIIICGKIITIKKLNCCSIIEIFRNDKIIPIVFMDGLPNVKIGDLVLGEFDVRAMIVSNNN